ncbi:MAG: hypothetical protein U0935_03140 [Pirellulales bacterium]
MNLFDWIARWRGQPSLGEMSDALAARSLESVWPLMEARVGELSSSELYGYVRARALPLVRELVRRTTAEQGRRMAGRSAELIDLTIAALVHLVVSRHRAQVTHVPVRRRAA